MPRQPRVGHSRSRGHQVQPGPEGDRHHLRPGHKLVPEEPRVDLALGRAPSEMQHTRIKDRHLAVFRQTHRLGQPDRQHRSAQPVLQRLTHRQVSRQRQHPSCFS
jgi:hypothetical protein